MSIEGLGTIEAQASGSPASGEPVLEVRKITKHYGRVWALHEVDLALYRGEVLALVGDNGSGKSTLVNILAGALAPTIGDIFVRGERVHFSSPLDARRAGIETVYQDLALAPDLPVWANFFMGRLERHKGLLGSIGWLDRKAMVERAKSDLEATRIRIPSVVVHCDALSGGQRQAIAVARAVAWGQSVLLMDEPTAALGVEEQDRVAELVNHAKSEGLGVLLVSHNLPQVHDIADRIAVLFRGRLLTVLDGPSTTVEETVTWITGAALRRQ